jgi:hypothetical protein
VYLSKGAPHAWLLLGDQWFCSILYAYEFYKSLKLNNLACFRGAMFSQLRRGVGWVTSLPFFVIVCLISAITRTWFWGGIITAAPSGDEVRYLDVAHIWKGVISSLAGVGDMPEEALSQIVGNAANIPGHSLLIAILSGPFDGIAPARIAMIILTTMVGLAVIALAPGDVLSNRVKRLALLLFAVSPSAIAWSGTLFNDLLWGILSLGFLFHAYSALFVPRRLSVSFVLYGGLLLGLCLLIRNSTQFVVLAFWIMTLAALVQVVNSRRSIMIYALGVTLLAGVVYSPWPIVASKVLEKTVLTATTTKHGIAHAYDPQGGRWRVAVQRLDDIEKRFGVSRTEAVDIYLRRSLSELTFSSASAMVARNYRALLFPEFRQQWFATSLGKDEIGGIHLKTWRWIWYLTNSLSIMVIVLAFLFPRNGRTGSPAQLMFLLATGAFLAVALFTFGIHGRYHMSLAPLVAIGMALWLTDRADAFSRWKLSGADRTQALATTGSVLLALIAIFVISGLQVENHPLSNWGGSYRISQSSLPNKHPYSIDLLDVKCVRPNGCRGSIGLVAAAGFEIETIEFFDIGRQTQVTESDLATRHDRAVVVRLPDDRILLKVMQQALSRESSFNRDSLRFLCGETEVSIEEPNFAYSACGIKLYWRGTVPPHADLKMLQKFAERAWL